LKGEVTFVPSPECPDLTALPSFFIEQKGSLVPYFIESISIRADKSFIKLEDVDSPEKAGELKGCSVYVARADRPKLKRGEFYNDEVIGFEVIDDQRGSLGHVTGVEEAGPNRFILIDFSSKEIMIPVNGPFIKNTNKTRKQITVELPDGFLDI
jgi:16S rRNA processing protein RimM